MHLERDLSFDYSQDMIKLICHNLFQSFCNYWNYGNGAVITWIILTACLVHSSNITLFPLQWNRATLERDVVHGALISVYSRISPLGRIRDLGGD